MRQPFSYNNIHSQVRNKVSDHEHQEQIYVFDHFDEYSDDVSKRRKVINKSNEMERWLNKEIQGLVHGAVDMELLNPDSGNGHVRRSERTKLSAFRTEEAQRKISGIVTEVKRLIGKQSGEP